MIANIKKIHIFHDKKYDPKGNKSHIRSLLYLKILDGEGTIIISYFTGTNNIFAKCNFKAFLTHLIRGYFVHNDLISHHTMDENIMGQLKCEIIFGTL